MSKPERVWTAALAVIGDEILSGRTQDRNIAQVADWLNQQGIRLREVRVVPDDPMRIGDAVNALRTAYDYLFTTGGIGPTHDDITIEAIAAACGVSVVIHPEARRMLERYYEPRKLELTEARLRMARVPQGAELIPNPTGGPPGVRFFNIFILAGIPSVARAMMDALDGQLSGGRPMVSVTIGAFAAESEIADLLRETEGSHPGVAIGSYPFTKDGRHGANFVIRSDDRALARDTGEDLSVRLSNAGFEPIEGGI
ncbi:MAG: molybdopterin-binding protein [Sphingomicrobium sp.]